MSDPCLNDQLVFRINGAGLKGRVGGRALQLKCPVAS